MAVPTDGIVRRRKRAKMRKYKKDDFLSLPNKIGAEFYKFWSPTGWLWCHLPPYMWFGGSGCIVTT